MSNLRSSHSSRSQGSRLEDAGDRPAGQTTGKVPMRVLHVIDSLGRRGGAERQMALAVGALDPERFTSYVCHLHEPSYLKPMFDAMGVPVYRLDVKGVRQWPAGIKKLRKLVKSLDIDLIHTSLFESDVIGGLTGRWTKVPVVNTLCSIGGEPERLVDNPDMNRLKLYLSTKLWGLVLGCCHRHCIAISKAVEQSSIKTYGVRKKNVSIIYRSLPDSWFTPVPETVTEQLRAALGLENAYPILLNVARMVPQKGQQYLLQAMPQVLAQFPRTRLLIAGEGPMRGELEALIQELGLQQAVTLLGPRTDVRDLLALCDVFVFPSLFEGLGNALVEATGMGKPCVASRVGPIPEVVEHGKSGLLVPSGSPQELAQAIIQVAGDRERAAAMGRRGREIALERFHIRRNIEKFEQTYTRVLNSC